jgi:hypothetical protein
MNIDFAQVLTLLNAHKDQFVIQFLMAEISPP